MSNAQLPLPTFISPSRRDNTRWKHQELNHYHIYSNPNHLQNGVGTYGCLPNMYLLFALTGVQNICALRSPTSGVEYTTRAEPVILSICGSGASTWSKPIQKERTSGLWMVMLEQDPSWVRKDIAAGSHQAALRGEHSWQEPTLKD